MSLGKHVPMGLVLASFLAAGCGPRPNDQDGGRGGSGGAGGAGDEFADAMVCSEVLPLATTQQEATPDVLLVVDRSPSMGSDGGAFPPGSGHQYRWDVMKEALAKLLPATEANVHYGMELFPLDGSNEPGELSASCCLTGRVVVDIGPLNAMAIQDQLAMNPPGGCGTPTTTSLEVGLGYWQSIPVNPDGRYNLLVTDGMAACLAPGTVNNVDGTVATLTKLKDAGIRTFVLGLGLSARESANLQRMADAGGTMMPYNAQNPDELKAALDAISGVIITVSCTYDLASPPADPSKVSVTVAGEMVPRTTQHTSGWDYDPACQCITFYGSWCERLRDNPGANLQVDLGCYKSPPID